MINKNSIEKITILDTEISNIQSLLIKTNYELYEIWNRDGQNEIQIWHSKKFHKTIHVEICINDPLSVNTNKVVNELVDLWLELRAIRNAIEDSDEDYFSNNNLEQTAFEKYNSNLEELEEEWHDSKNYLSKIFKDEIDPAILAYLHLDEDDKYLLTN